MLIPLVKLYFKMFPVCFLKNLCHLDTTRQAACWGEDTKGNRMKSFGLQFSPSGRGNRHLHRQLRQGESCDCNQMSRKCRVGGSIILGAPHP